MDMDAQTVNGSYGLMGAGGQSHAPSNLAVLLVVLLCEFLRSA